MVVRLWRGPAGTTFSAAAARGKVVMVAGADAPEAERVVQHLNRSVAPMTGSPRMEGHSAVAGPRNCRLLARFCRSPPPLPPRGKRRWRANAASLRARRPRQSACTFVAAAASRASRSETSARIVDDKRWGREGWSGRVTLLFVCVGAAQPVFE